MKIFPICRLLGILSKLTILGAGLLLAGYVGSIQVPQLD